MTRLPTRSPSCSPPCSAAQCGENRVKPKRVPAAGPFDKVSAGVVLALVLIRAFAAPFSSRDRGLLAGLKKCGFLVFECAHLLLEGVAPFGAPWLRA